MTVSGAEPVTIRSGTRLKWHCAVEHNAPAEREKNKLTIREQL
jgi:hypothetical protein